MAFVVTTYELVPTGVEHMGAVEMTREPSSQRAVATLEDACGPFARPPGEREESMRARVDRATTYDYLRLWTPGTPPLRLPDGTLIEVEAMPGIVLAKVAGLTGREALACSIAQDWAPAVAAFNAMQAIV